MSINATQKHKLAGLGSGSFGNRSISVNTKTSGVSSQAAKNLRGATAASSQNSVFNGMFRKSSSFNRVSGQNTLKGRNQVNLNRRRAGLNNNGVRRTYETATPVYVAAMPQQQGMSTLQKIMTYGSMAITGALMGYQAVKGLTNSQRMDAAMSSLGNPEAAPQLASTVGQSSVSSMRNAQTSGELSSAISNAEGQLNQMKQTAASGNYESKATEAKSNMDNYKSDVSDKKENVNTAKQNVKTADQEVSATTTMRDSKLTQLEKADANYGKAVKANTQAKDTLSQANQNLEVAETKLNNTPKTITDANGNQIPNPEHQKAQEAVNLAKEKKQTAETEQKKAQQAEAEAKAAVDKSNTEVTQAKEDLDKAQEKLDSAKNKQTTANKNLQKAEADYKKAQETYDNAQEAVQKFQDYQHDIKELEGEIANQKERLEKIQEKEDKRLEKIDKKIDKNGNKNDKAYAKIDTSDGLNWREKIKLRRMEHRNAKNNQYLAEKDAIIAGQQTQE